MRRTAMCWVQPAGDGRAYPVWHLWHEQRMYVVTGGGEQDLPACEEAVVVVRDPDRPAERAGQWTAQVLVISPGTAEWEQVTPLLAERRLNALGGQEQPQRWAAECVLRALVPGT